MRRIALLLVACWVVLGSWATVPVGYYYLANNKKKDELKSALHQIVSQARMLSYGSGEQLTTWNGFFHTDRDTTDNSVVDRYSLVKRFFVDSISSVAEMHIEHLLPNSWWGHLHNNAYKDLHHLYPADGEMNMRKSNNPLGEVSVVEYENGLCRVGQNAFGTAYTDRCFEPADEYKGDFARTYLYMSVAYEDMAPLWVSPMMGNNTYPVWEPWAIDLLMKWHAADPVSEQERERMERVYALQGNRNPFVDYPELVDYIWGKDTLVAYTFPHESAPFLVAPSRWERVDFGVVMQNSAQHIIIPYLGVNITADVELTLKSGTRGFACGTSRLSATQAQQGGSVELSFVSNAVGQYTDTLCITGGGGIAPLYVPLCAMVASEFLALAPTEVEQTSTTLHWMSYAGAEGYSIDLFQGAQRAGDLMISAYVEGSNWNKAIEIYNGTGRRVNLAHYSLRKQNNGMGAFVGELPLTGYLESGATYLLVHGAAQASLLQQASYVDESDYKAFLSFNGDDAVALYREGVMVDVVGLVGSTKVWGRDVTLVRKAQYAQPTLSGDMTQWSASACDDYSVLGTFQPQFAAQERYVLQGEQVGKVTNYTCKSLLPGGEYLYRVYAHLSGGERVTTSNDVCFRTDTLTAPVAFEPSQVTANGFCAEWESEYEAEHYLLSVYEVRGSGEQQYKEGFDHVGSNGTPLPDGWTGNVSSTYTSATNSEEVPSIKFASSGEYLQTPTYGTITSLSFMGKYVSGATGSNMKVSAYGASGWEAIDTIYWENNTKRTYSYALGASKQYTAIRFDYTKVGGNFALDDVTVRAGAQDLIPVAEREEVTGQSHCLSALQPATRYLYYVEAECGGIISPVSNSVYVTTEVYTRLEEAAFASGECWAHLAPRVLGFGSNAHQVQIYDATGRCIWQCEAASGARYQFASAGVYVLLIDGDAHKVVLP